MDAGRPGKEVEVSATDGSVNCHQADTPHAAPVAENGISDSESSNTVVHFTLDSGEAGDIILDAGDRHFSCHKKVLQHHSPYFKAMFKSGMKESHSEIISLGDVNSKYLQCLLDYFYTGNLGLTELNVQGVVEVSSLLQVSSALDQCCQLLLTIIDDDLCLSLMWLADFLMLEEVYDRSCRHALWHFHGVSQTEDFFLASPAKLVNYLQDPHLNIDSEVDVFRAAAEWYSAQEKPCDVTDLTAFFGRLVNFHLMTNEEVALLKDLVVVEKEQTLKSFVASVSLDIITRLRKEVMGQFSAVLLLQATLLN